MNNIIPLPEGSLGGCMVTPPGPWTNWFIQVVLYTLIYS